MLPETVLVLARGELEQVLQELWQGHKGSGRALRRHQRAAAAAALPLPGCPLQTTSAAALPEHTVPGLVHVLVERVLGALWWRGAGAPGDVPRAGPL